MARNLGCIAAVVLALAGCGSEEGGWTPIPGGNDPIEVTGVIGLPDEAPPESSGGIIPSPVRDRVQLVTCEATPAVEIPLESGAPVPAYDVGNGQACLGEPNTATPTLCWKVKAFEARAAAVATCYGEVWKQLDMQGNAILGREWTKLALPMLPAVWSKTPEEVHGLSSQVSTGLTHLLTGGQANYAPGAPLCFPMINGQTVDEAKTAALSDIKNLVRDTQAELDSVVLALKKGINVQVTKDLRLNVAVKIVEHQSNLEAIGTCEFHSPI